MQYLYEPDVIELPTESGGPHDGGIGKLKVDLYKLLTKYCESTHCNQIKFFSVRLRVSGDIYDYGEEAIQNIRLYVKKECINAEIIIPKSRWENIGINIIKEYLADRVKEALIICVERIKKKKLTIDSDTFFKNVDKAISEFKSTNYSEDFKEEPMIKNALNFIQQFLNKKES